MKDATFWEDEMINKLKKFYFEHMLPEIVDPRYSRNMDFR